MVSIYNVIDAKDAEAVYNDGHFIKKADMYKAFHPFLGTGLLTSEGLFILLYNFYTYVYIFCFMSTLQVDKSCAIMKL